MWSTSLASKRRASRLVRAAGLAAWLCGSLLACRQHSADHAFLSGTPGVLVSLGPTPGPRDNVAVAKSPFASDATTLNDGRVYFLRYNCAGCHGDHAGGGMGPSLRDDAWLYGGDEAHIFDSIAEGRAQGMPAWGAKLPEDIVWKLVAYIQSLRTDREPDPPDQSVPEPPQ